MKTIHVLRFIIPQQDHINHINSGGCGIFADAVREQILARGEECSVHILANHYWGGEVDSIQATTGMPDLNSALQCATANGISWRLGHIGVVYKGRVFDSTGDITKEWTPRGDNLTDETLKGMLSRDIGWNQTFKRHNGGSDSTLLAHIKGCFAHGGRG